MIEFRNVSKAYELKGVKKQIFEDLSVSFPSNRNIAIMGKNGAGKSTMMRLISGSELPDQGRVIRTSNISWPLGFSGGFNGEMTGIENIRFVSRLYGRDAEPMIKDVQEFAELGESIRLPIRTYSSGMKARLAFGISLSIDFDCYLIDEITAVGDGNFRKKSEGAFKKKLETSQIIMVSHSASTIKTYCDCGYLIADNQTKYFDDISSLLNAYDEHLK